MHISEAILKLLQKKSDKLVRKMPMPIKMAVRLEIIKDSFASLGE
jgi:hypothetical protein